MKTPQILKWIDFIDNYFPWNHPRSYIFRALQDNYGNYKQFLTNVIKDKLPPIKTKEGDTIPFDEVKEKPSSKRRKAQAIIDKTVNLIPEMRKLSIDIDNHTFEKFGFRSNFAFVPDVCFIMLLILER